MNKVFFIAGLSNGETITEDKGAYAVTSGAPSPYQRLLRYCEDNQLRITSLSLASADGRRWNVPSAGKNPKFKAFADAPHPVSYRFFRKMGGDVMGKAIVNEERYAIAEAAYEDGRTMQMWLDQNTLNCWSILL